MASKFIRHSEVPVTEFDWGSAGMRASKDNTGCETFVVMDVTLEPGFCHDFHKHPDQDEMIIVRGGRITQYLDRESRELAPGDSVYVDRNVVHGSYNDGDEPGAGAHEAGFDQGWGEGLPIRPPTRAAVGAMLACKLRDRHDALGPIPPAHAHRQRGKIAIHEVMTDCEPEYFPVVLAAVEAVLDKNCRLYGIQTATNNTTPLMIINGYGEELLSSLDATHPLHGDAQEVVTAAGARAEAAEPTIKAVAAAVDELAQGPRHLGVKGVSGFYKGVKGVRVQHFSPQIHVIPCCIPCTGKQMLEMHQPVIQTHPMWQTSLCKQLSLKGAQVLGRLWQGVHGHVHQGTGRIAHGLIALVETTRALNTLQQIIRNRLACLPMHGVALEHLALLSPVFKQL